MGKDNSYMAKYVSYRYLKLKIRALEYKGGKCLRCGYDKCYSALQFHHRDPSEKEMDWKYLRKRSWDFIKLELDKCDLLCSNCHAEVHHDDEKLKEAISWLNEKKRKPAKNYGFGICRQCEKKYDKNHDNHKTKFCSIKCRTKAQEVADYPEDEEFIKMVDELGQNATGRKLKVSARTIKRRYNKIKNNQLTAS